MPTEGRRNQQLILILLVQDQEYQIYFNFKIMIEFIKTNYDQLLSIATGVVALASAICALTPTPKDDGVVKKLYAIVEWLALNIGKAKDK